MIVLFDLSDPYKLHEGIMVYAINILKGLRDNGYKNIKILVHDDLYNHVNECFPEYTCIKFEEAPKRKFLNILYIAKTWAKQINEIDCDVVFSPYPSLYHLYSKKKIVQTIHDIQPLKIWKGKNLLKYKLFIPIVLKRSYRIISISEFVKKDILNNFKFVSKDKISCIPNPVVVDTTKYPRLEWTDYKYILYISNLWEYKNVGTLIKAFNIIKDKFDHKLVIVGRTTEYWTNEIKPFIEKNGLYDRIIHVDRVVSDRELTQLYQHTELFVHPSLLEGFGFTPIEAAIHGAPVITTTETALKESTLGILNYYVPATDEKSLAEKMNELLKKPQTKEELDRISETFLSEYNYKKQASKVYEFLKQTL